MLSGTGGHSLAQPTLLGKNPCGENPLLVAPKRLKLIVVQ